MKRNARVRKADARPQPATIYSTSEARANFAEALEAAKKEGAVIGFDRYGQTVAALVPLEAIYMLAGRGAYIAPTMRDRIERGARNLVQDILQPDAQLEREQAPRRPGRPRGSNKAPPHSSAKPKRAPKS